MSNDYVTYEEFNEFKNSLENNFKSIYQIFSKYSEGIATTTRLGLVAQTLAYAALLNQEDKKRVISILEDLSNLQHDSFLFLPVPDEQIKDFRQHLAVFIERLRNLNK